ncbi:hypothetical protein R1sor_004607 [Riccia sorocarpa]|uniref:Uncharacterized protein n=1 Tax=Riccia sorocarpa TaxID=122646 RepID=A0ABD3HLG9_9MARC
MKARKESTDEIANRSSTSDGADEEPGSGRGRGMWGKKEWSYGARGGGEEGRLEGPGAAGVSSFVTCWFSVLWKKESEQREKRVGVGRSGGEAIEKNQSDQIGPRKACALSLCVFCASRQIDGAQVAAAYCLGEKDGACASVSEQKTVVSRKRVSRGGDEERKGEDAGRKQSRAA